MEMTGSVDDALAAKGLAPGRHYLDSGRLSAARLVAEAARHGIALIGPLQAGTSAQARAGQARAGQGYAGRGYARADFTAGYDAQRVTCPQRKTSSSWSPCSQYGRDAIVATSARSDCEPCPVKELYRGLRKTRLGHAFMAVALNLLRLNAYWNGNPLDRARTSHLARLELNLAA